MMGKSETTLFLLFRLGAELGALPVERVLETMRPLPVEALASAPEFVLGLAVIRGLATPVVDTGRLLANRSRPPTRFVVVSVGKRRIALAVDSVVGIRALPTASLGALPPLVAQSDRSAVDAIGTLDSELLLVLASARLLPEAAWARLEAEARTS